MSGESHPLAGLVSNLPFPLPWRTDGLPARPYAQVASRVPT